LFCEMEIKELKKLLGENRVLSSPEEKRAYSYDASRQRAMPDVVVLPESTRDVQKIMQFASLHNISVYPRGAGTGMTGGALPQKGGIALVMTAMNKILDIDTTNLTARVQPGVILYDLKEAVKKKGLFYPPDPASAKFSTIGGSVAVNAGGLNSVKYNVTRDYVLSLEAVSAQGEVLRFGANTRKSVSGYDLTRLVVGSEGTLVVITEIQVKLIPNPKTIATLIAVFPDDQSALKAALEIIREPMVPSTLEFLDETAVYCAYVYTKNPFLKEAGGALLLEFDSAGQEQESENVSREISRAGKIVDSCGAIRSKETRNPAEREKLWEVRRCLSPAVYEIAPTKLNQDICVPRSEMPEVIREIKRIARDRGIKVVNFAHAGDGNIHVNFMYNGEDKNQREQAYKAAEELCRVTISHGGTLSGEHGIGITKSRFLSLEFGESEINLMRQIKKVFDPKGILNPGKIFKE